MTERPYIHGISPQLGPLLAQAGFTAVDNRITAIHGPRSLHPAGRTRQRQRDHLRLPGPRHVIAGAVPHCWWGL